MLDNNNNNNNDSSSSIIIIHIIPTFIWLLSFCFLLQIQKYENTINLQFSLSCFYFIMLRLFWLRLIDIKKVYFTILWKSRRYKYTIQCVCLAKRKQMHAFIIIYFPLILCCFTYGPFHRLEHDTFLAGVQFLTKTYEFSVFHKEGHINLHFVWRKFSLERWFFILQDQQKIWVIQ